MPFNQQAADIAINFFERILKHTADEWYGQPFLLSPWQEEAVSQIFGQIDDHGNRTIETVYLEVPKKSGKTELAAGLVLLVLVLNKMPGCQVYGAASATRQAMNVYRAACKMWEQSPLLKQNLRLLRGTNRILKRSDPDSFYAAIAADGDFGDGVNPACTIADEVHRWKTRKQLENWDVLSKGGITRKQTLTVAITTAGVQSDSPLAWMLHEKAQRIADGVVSDPKFYGRIYAAAKTDDPALESTWIKANPSLRVNGGFLEIEKIREKYVSAVAEGDLTSFKRYFLNIWDQKENLAIDMQKWDACGPDSDSEESEPYSASLWRSQGLLPNPGPTIIDAHLIDAPKVRPLPHDLMAHFVGRRCWAGVDLSMTTDTSALALVFPCEDGAGDGAESYDVLPFFWLPDDKIRKLQISLGVPLEKWAEQGFLELSPGEVVDYREIRARLEWAAQMFDLAEICWDPWNSRQLSVPMIEDGYTCVEIRQGYRSLSEPTKKVLELVSRGAMHHGAHPMLRWQAGCCATITDGRDNIMFSKPDREKSTARIDGPAAIVNAMFRAMLAQGGGITYTGIKSVG